MRAHLALTMYLAFLAPGIAPAAYPAPGPLVIDRDPFPLNRTELQGWEFRPSFMSCGAPEAGITLPHYWKDSREGTFSREVVIPRAMKGRAVFFQAVADTGGELFLDGTSRGSFGFKGRILLTRRAAGDERYRVALKCRLEKPFGVFTDASLIDLDAGLLPLYLKISRAERMLSSLSSSEKGHWRFNPGNDPRFGDPSFDDSAWEKVSVKHYGVKSFSSGWYRKLITLPETIGGIPVKGLPVSLDVTVNDHVEAFVDGKRLGYFRDRMALPLRVKAAGGDTVPVALRVRNNFGKGGLVDAALRFPFTAVELPDCVSLLRHYISFTSAGGKAGAAELDAAEALADAIIAAAGSTTEDDTRRNRDEVRLRRARLGKILSQNPPIIAGPWLQNPSPGAVTVMWETAVPGNGRVVYGENPGRMKTLRAPGKNTIHRVRLGNLSPGRKYYYRVASGGAAGKLHSFTAWPRQAGAFTFLVWGDTRSDTVAHGKVTGAMSSENAAFAVNMGDVVMSGAREEWVPDYFFPVGRFLSSLPTFLVTGNHEYYSMDGRGRVPWFERYTEQPGNGYWFSFDHGNCHFIVLDSNKAIPSDLRPESGQYRWLVKDLEGPASRRADWRFVFMHHPLYTKGWSGEYYDGEPLLRERLRPLFERHGVTMVFHGHTHGYEFGRLPKGDGVAYVITGGGGSPLDDTVYKNWDHVDRVEFKYHYSAIQVSGKKLRFRAVDTNGKVFDERVFGK